MKACRAGRTSAAVALCIVSFGCEARLPYQFSFVDATTRRPLGGARVTWYEDGYHCDNRFLTVHNATELPAPGPDATVAVDIVYEWKNSLMVVLPGYRATYVSSFHYPGPNSWFIEYNESDVVEPRQWGDPIPTTFPPGELNVIPVYPLGQPLPKP